jgi:hypothetical protein
MEYRIEFINDILSSSLVITCVMGIAYKFADGVSNGKRRDEIV